MPSLVAHKLSGFHTIPGGDRDEVMRLVDRDRNRHMGWNVKHFYAWYKREGSRSQLHVG